MVAPASAHIGLSKDQTFMLLSLVGDLRVMQVVDGETGDI
jgi:acetamidase/formamidase